MNYEPTRLEAQALAIARGERELIGQLDFKLAANELAIVTGSNGSGKTSLLRVLAGAARPARGRVLWDGTANAGGTASIAYQGHLDGLKKALTSVENLEFYRRLWRSSTEIRPLLEELGLLAYAGLPLRMLSAGQRRRIGLALLRIRQARLWVLDEPSTNLDRDGRALMRRWLADHLARGGAAVVATHAPQELPSAGALLIEL